MILTIRKYPKILLILLVYLLTFFTFSFLTHLLETALTSASYLGILFSGIMYAFSFTGSIATVSLVILSENYNILLLSILGGLGAATADLTILKALKKFGIDEELNRLGELGIFKKFKLKSFLSRLIMTFSGIFVVASPLPDELGLILLKKGNMLSIKHIFVTGFILNAVGIYAILNIVHI